MSMSGWFSQWGADGRDGLRFRLMLRAKDTARCRLVVLVGLSWIGVVSSTGASLSSTTAGVGALGVGGSAVRASEDERAS